jgi:hypothetical protein
MQAIVAVVPEHDGQGPAPLLAFKQLPNHILMLSVSSCYNVLV